MRVAAIGGYQAKVALVDDDGLLRLDGAVRDDAGWRPMAVELPDAMAAELNARLQQLEPQESALRRMLRERLGG